MLAEPKKIVFAIEVMGKPTPAEVEGAPDKQPTSIGISLGARNAFSQFCERRNGMAVKDALSSLVLRFLSQPEVVQRVLLGEVTEGMGAAYAEMLEKLAQTARLLDDPKARNDPGVRDSLRALNLDGVVTVKGPQRSGQGSSPHTTPNHPEHGDGGEDDTGSSHGRGARRRR